jgi:hypothetical protein
MSATGLILGILTGSFQTHICEMQPHIPGNVVVVGQDDRKFSPVDRLRISTLVLSTKKEAWFRFVAYEMYGEPYQLVVPGSLVRWARAWSWKRLPFCGAQWPITCPKFLIRAGGLAKSRSGREPSRPWHRPSEPRSRVDGTSIERQ